MPRITYTGKRAKDLVTLAHPRLILPPETEALRRLAANDPTHDARGVNPQGLGQSKIERLLRRLYEDVVQAR